MDGEYRTFPAAADGSIWIETPFSCAYVADLKGELPKFARQWDDDLKMWRIAAAFVDGALEIARRYFTPADDGDAAAPGRSGHNGRGSASPSPPESAQPWATLWLIPGAPAECVRACYRALTRVHHPDAGGDESAMKEINGAYTALLEVAT